MPCSLVGLNSCSIRFRDPRSTNPRGRLQADLARWQYGALAEFEERNDCGDIVSCGVGVCLWGVDQTEFEDPPAGFQNPLRVSSDNKLWVKLDTGCVQFGQQVVDRISDVGEPTAPHQIQCVKCDETGCSAMYVSKQKADGSIVWQKLALIDPDAAPETVLAHTHDANTGAVTP